ncbi:MAG: tetratricopeptide repeat protein, partial [Alphaproteobacteria bacterium]
VRVRAKAMRTLQRIAFAAWAVVVLLPVLATPAQADFADGLAAYDAGDYRSAFAEWQPLAESGDSTAQVAIAGLYLSGYGVRADIAEALRWYHLAAEAGSAVAQLNLGDAYARGLGVAVDPVSAYVWFSLAAAQGRQWPEMRRRELALTLCPAQIADAEARLARR